MTAVANGMTLLHALGAIPIPLGHRVEVRIFMSPGGAGLFGMGEPAPQYESPLLTDLETGVRYGNLTHFHPPVSAYTTGQTFNAGYAPLAELREHSRFYGKVVVCNVMYTGYSRNEIQTTFLIEPIAPPHPGYR